MTINVKTCSVYWCVFSDLNQNSYDNLKGMKFDLNVSASSVKFSANIQGLFSFSLYKNYGD